MASIRPGCASLATRRTPLRPWGERVGEELLPRCGGLAGCYAHSQHFVVTIIVDPGGNQKRAGDHASAFSHFHGQRVSGNERERPGIIEGTVTELLDMLLQVCFHARDPRFRQSCKT